MFSRLSASLRLCAILVVVSPALGAEPLVWKWKEGESVRYLTTQSTHSSIDGGPAGTAETSMREDTIVKWTPIEVMKDGSAKLEVQTERVVMQNKGKGGQDFTYDSDSGDPPAGMAALVTPMYEALIEYPFTMTMLPSGETTDVVLTDGLSQAVDKLPGGAVSGEMIAKLTKQAVLRFPKEPLAVGDKWTNTMEVITPAIGTMKVDTTYVYDGKRDAEGKEYEAFTPSTRMEMLDKKEDFSVDIETKDSTGEVLFDRERGRLFRSRKMEAMAVRLRVAGYDMVTNTEQTIEMRELGKDETPTLGAPAEEEAAEEEAEAPPTEEPAATE